MEAGGWGRHPCGQTLRARASWGGEACATERVEQHQTVTDGGGGWGWGGEGSVRSGGDESKIQKTVKAGGVGETINKVNDSNGA